MRNISSRKLHAGLVALAALSSVLVTGCSSEGIIDPVSKDRVALQLKASIGDASSRSVSTDLHETSFLQGEKIKVLIGQLKSDFYSGNIPEVVASHIYTFSDNNGNLASEDEFFLQENENAYVVGFYPSSFISSIAGFNSSYTFTVQSDQSTDENYNQSDAMLATSQSVSYNSSSATLQFAHCLSKIKLVLSSNTYDVTAAKVSLSEILPTASFTGMGPKPQEATGTAQDIVLKDETNTATTVCGIIPPQTIALNTAFFKVTIGTETFTAVLDATNDFTFEPGKEYTYNIYIDRSKVTVVSAKITGWTPISDTPTDIFM